MSKSLKNVVKQNMNESLDLRIKKLEENLLAVRKLSSDFKYVVPKTEKEKLPDKNRNTTKIETKPETKIEETPKPVTPPKAFSLRDYLMALALENEADHKERQKIKLFRRKPEPNSIQEDPEENEDKKLTKAISEKIGENISTQVTEANLNTAPNLINNLNVGNSANILNLPTETQETIKPAKRVTATVINPKAKLNAENLQRKFKPIPQSKTFLADEIIYQFNKYEKKKLGLTEEELNEIPDFRVKDFFSTDKLEKQIDSLFNLGKKEKSKSPAKKFRINYPPIKLKSREKYNDNLAFILPSIKDTKTVKKEPLPDFMKPNKKLEREKIILKSKKAKLSLENYQESILYTIKDFVSTENIRKLASNFKQIAEKNQVKQKDEKKGHVKKLKGPKSRWENVLEKISPYIPEYLYEKLKTIK